jgi:heptosyltransferase-1
MKILIIKTSSLGDIVHCNPIISDMQKNLDYFEIDWLVEKSFVDLVNFFPVNNIIQSNFRKWKKNILHRRSFNEFRSLQKQIEINNYDLVIDAQGLIRTGLLCNRKISYGYASNSIKEPIASFFYNKKLIVSKDLHAIDRNRILVAKVFNYQVNLNSPKFTFKLDKFDTKQNDIFFITGTSNEKKKWPLRRWIELANYLSKNNISIKLPWGNAEEYKDCLIISENSKNVKILPKLKINQLANMISQAKHVIGVDSGLTHLSSALNIPTICIFKKSKPHLTGVKNSNGLSVNIGNFDQDVSVDEVIRNFESTS